MKKVAIMSKESSSFLIRDQYGLCAGLHYHLDIYDCNFTNDIEYIRNSLKDATEKARATLLSINLHAFDNYGGVSGVAILAESHISIHTWPELCFAALDVFMCGNTFPEKAIASLNQAFGSKNSICYRYRRGDKVEHYV